MRSRCTSPAIRHAVAQTLEDRRLLAILIVDVVSGVMGVRSSTTGYVHVPYTGSSPTLDGTSGDDTIYIVETDGRFLTVDPKSGVDTIIFGDSPNDGTDHDNDLDQLSDAGVRVLAGSDSSDNLIEVRDDQDATSNSYTISETSFGRMKLVKNDLPANESEWLEWETANVDAVVRTSSGNGVVDIGTSVQINSTDESLTIDDSFGDGGSTVNFDGGWSSPAQMPSVLGGSGADQLNYTHLPGIWNSDDLFFNGDAGTDGLYIDMAGSRADLKQGEIEVFATAGSALIDYFGVENLIVDNQTTVAATYNLISAGGTLAWADTTIIGSSGADSVIVGATGGVINEVNVDLTLQLSSGLDSLAFNDLFETTGRSYGFANNVISFGAASTVSWATALELVTVNGGGGNDTVTVGDGVDLTGITLNGGFGSDTFNLRANASADMVVTGGSPTAAPGDVLNLTLGGESQGLLTTTSPTSGDYTFSNREPISFSGIETFTQPGAAPASPDLDAASDSGQSNSDNVTRLVNATFTGNVGEANAPVRLFNGPTLIGSGTSGAGGAYSIVASLPPGTATLAITVTVERASSPLMSAASVATSVTIDTVAPAAPTSAPDLRIASDTGVLDTDNITNDVTPSFNVTTTDLTRFQAGGTTVFDYAAGAIVTLPTQADGTYGYSVRSVDLAGNESAASASLSVTIDSTAPVMGGGAPDLLAGNDTGASNTDNITNDPQPSFSVSGAAGAQYARLYRGATQITENWQLASGVQAIDMLEGPNVITGVLFDAAGNASTTTPAITVTLDTVRPQLTGSPAFLFEREFTQPHAITYVFNENVEWSVAASDFAVTNSSTSAAQSPTVAYNAALNRALVRFPASVGGGSAVGALEDGNYVSQVAANNVRDVAGNPLNASSTLTFHVLAGDANRDKRVNFDDLLILASNYNATSRTFSQGNFDYDPAGTANFDDLLVLASRYNVSLPAAAPPAPLMAGGTSPGSGDDDGSGDVLV